MKKTLLFVVVSVVAVSGGLFAARARAQSDDRALINTVYQQFATAFRHKDLNAMMALYVHDNSLFVFDIGTPREHVGWENYRDDWRDTFASIKGSPQFTIGELGVTISGDVAYTRSIQSFSGNMGKIHAFAVRVTDVLRKIDGKWLIVQEHVSVPINFQNLKPDLMSRP